MQEKTEHEQGEMEIYDLTDKKALEQFLSACREPEEGQAGAEEPPFLFENQLSLF